jgi:Ca2+-binding RTX toxin-like protein
LPRRVKNALERAPYRQTRLLETITMATFVGADKADILNGTDGSDAIYGLGGNDWINGLAGNDFLKGGGGTDIINGGPGNDFIIGGTEADWMIGGLDNDTYLVDQAADLVTEYGGQGIDTVLTSVDYVLPAGADVETLATNSDNGTADLLLVGNSSGNSVRGNNGDNTIGGREGNDELTGLGGRDGFMFATSLDAATNVDTITDFNVVDDTILLFAALFNELGDSISPGEFVIGTAAVDAADRLIYDIGTGAVFYDSDGVGGTAAVQFATLDAGLGLTYQDFRLYQFPDIGFPDFSDWISRF